MGKSWFALLMIQLADNLPHPLPTVQVRMKSYLLRRKILFWATAQPFLRALQYNLVQVVQKVDNANHQINHYPVDSMVCFVNTYPQNLLFPAVCRIAAISRFHGMPEI